MSECLLRPALPDELHLLIDIDDDACALYAEAGLRIALPPGHPFAADEQARWAACMRAGGAWLAVAAGQAVGFAAIGSADGEPYLDQLSVRRDAMGRGIGTRLLRHALAVSAPAGALWLTTYAHLAWNRPYYERHGFILIEEARCGPQIREHLHAQRAVLPVPQERVAMRHLHASSRPHPIPLLGTRR